MRYSIVAQATSSHPMLTQQLLSNIHPILSPWAQTDPTMYLPHMTPATDAVTILRNIKEGMNPFPSNLYNIILSFPIDPPFPAYKDTN